MFTAMLITEERKKKQRNKKTKTDLEGNDSIEKLSLVDVGMG